MRLMHNYWGVMLSLVITGFPFTFLLTLSYVTGIDPALEQAGAMLGARARARFFRILLPLLAPGPDHHAGAGVRAGVLGVPVGVLLGAPAGPTRVISIAAYQAAFEQYDYSLASAIAMIMAGVQVLIVVALLALRGLAYPRPGQHRARADRDATPHGERLWAFTVWALVGFFVVNLLAMIGSVVVNSFGTPLVQHLAAGRLHDRNGTRWPGTSSSCRPSCWSPRRWSAPWCVLSGADRRARRLRDGAAQFPGKRPCMLLFLLPLMVPPITYGIPLATVLYQAHLAGTIWGVILANLVPTVPFVILIMIPFVEQIDPRVEAAARVFGAGLGRLFVQVLVPLLTPGILAALLLVLVRTIAMFELTFLTAGPDSQTLVVALYYAVFAAGVRPGQSIDAMAVVYMVTTLVWLLIALRFVNPTQIVTRAKR